LSVRLERARKVQAASDRLAFLPGAACVRPFVCDTVAKIDSLSTTMIYTHIVDDDMETAMRALDI
jgi:hypothetical protein